MSDGALLSLAFVVTCVEVGVAALVAVAAVALSFVAFAFVLSFPFPFVLAAFAPCAPDVHRCLSAACWGMCHCV